MNHPFCLFTLNPLRLFLTLSLPRDLHKVAPVPLALLAQPACPLRPGSPREHPGGHPLCAQPLPPPVPAGAELCAVPVDGIPGAELCLKALQGCHAASPLPCQAGVLWLSPGCWWQQPLAGWLCRQGRGAFIPPGVKTSPGKEETESGGDTTS